jgi:hypothetical protein
MIGCSQATTDLVEKMLASNVDYHRRHGSTVSAKFDPAPASGRFGRACVFGLRVADPWLAFFTAAV